MGQPHETVKLLRKPMASAHLSARAALPTGHINHGNDLMVQTLPPPKKLRDSLQTNPLTLPVIVVVKPRRTLLSENFHTPMGSFHCWLYVAV